jgi:transposase
MPQVQLPIFPQGTTLINPELAFQRKGDQIVYYNGHLPVFTHAVSDLVSFRVFTTQLLINSTASYGQISKAFGVPMRSLKRYTRRFRDRGMAAFTKPVVPRAGSRLTAEKLTQCQALLDEGSAVPQVSEKAGVLATTLHKAIQSGRLRVSKKKTWIPLQRRTSRPRANAARVMRRRRWESPRRGPKND